MQVDAASIEHAVHTLRRGGVIAYPTEAVFGFGCNPQNVVAVQRLLDIKQRDASQGLPLIAADFAQIAPYIADDCPSAALERAQSSWPGPHTWVFPPSGRAPAWIIGDRGSIALRVTAHSVAAALCRAFESPLVSTSANHHGTNPALDVHQVEREFGSLVDAIVAGDVGDSVCPTTIRDAVSGEWLRR
ncbi:MAG: Sua5/YciO/YrdC/YwlC family protein [Dokdonella sp.]